jgi:hypothetical protein
VIERFGRKGTELNGVFFTEGSIDGGAFIGDVLETSGRQNISLDELKQSISAKVLAKGGNAVDNFKYVQQGSVFSFSNTRWRVTGRMLRVSE